MMALCELLEKSPDADVLREMICFAAERPMELDVQGLSEAGLATVLLVTCHVKAALPAMVVEIDRKGSQGIAQLLCVG